MLLLFMQLYEFVNVSYSVLFNFLAKGIQNTFFITNIGSYNTS